MGINAYSEDGIGMAGQGNAVDFKGREGEDENREDCLGDFNTPDCFWQLDDVVVGHGCCCM